MTLTKEDIKTYINTRLDEDINLLTSEMLKYLRKEKDTEKASVKLNEYLEALELALEVKTEFNKQWGE